MRKLQIFHAFFSSFYSDYRLADTFPDTTFQLAEMIVTLRELPFDPKEKIADYIFKCIFFYENLCVLIRVS